MGQILCADAEDVIPSQKFVVPVPGPTGPSSIASAMMGPSPRVTPPAVPPPPLPPVPIPTAGVPPLQTPKVTSPPQKVASPTPTPKIPATLPHNSPTPNSNANAKKDEDENVSTYTTETDATVKKDDGTAPVMFHRRKSLTTKIRRNWCCRKRRKADQDDTGFLRSVSTAKGLEMRGSGDDDGDEDVACFGTTSECVPTPVTVRIRSPNGSRRTRIPNRPDVSMSLWSLVKNAIGKDLTKLPLPVNFNEPLSMLQRLTEDFEYSYLLDKAAAATNPIDQIAYVAAFTVSSYATSANRTGKPFNPLLGETYECDRTEDLGWRCLCEQVCHHPPLASQHCQGRKWICWQQFSMTSRFRGNSIEITPLGLSHLLFPKTGVHYTWKKVPSIVHNIMLGKLWIDQEGEMDIYNHTSGGNCHIKYNPTAFFRGDAKKVDGTVYDVDKTPKIQLTGFWDSKMEAFDITNVSKSGKYTLGPPRLLWTRTMPPVDSERYYNFTLLACQLNEMEEDVAPTDSRNRPDQRLMENCFFDEANNEKLRLEEKQRAARKLRLCSVPSKSKTLVTRLEDGAGNELTEVNYTPAWFNLQKDPVSGKFTHMFNGEYWDCKKSQDWSRCQEIY